MARGFRLSGDNALAALQQSMRSRMREDEARHRTTDGGVESRHATTGRSAVGPDDQPAGAAMPMASSTPSRRPEENRLAGVAPGPSTQFAPSEPRSVAGHPDCSNASSAGAPTRKDGGQGTTPAAAAPINVADAAPSGRARADAATKYRNKRTNGYASKREAKRAAELRTLEAIGDIRNLREQVPFLLIPKQDGERACSFVADFVYDERIQAAWPDEGWARVVEDCKGYRTEVYRIKRKLLLFVHGIRVRET